jgi:hypothetical protein
MRSGAARKDLLRLGGRVARLALSDAHCAPASPGKRERHKNGLAFETSPEMRRRRSASAISYELRGGGDTKSLRDAATLAAFLFVRLGCGATALSRFGLADCFLGGFIAGSYRNRLRRGRL